MRNYLLGGLLTIELSFSIFSEVKAATISLDFDSLPTEQGWEVWSNISSPPNNLFSVDGTVLQQNTIGTGSLGIGFEIKDVIDIDESFTLSFTARVINEEIVNTGFNIPFGFGVFLGSGTQAFGVGLGVNSIADGSNSTSSIAVNNSFFRDYRLEGSFATGIAELYIDNIFVTNLSTYSSSGNNSLLIADGTQTRNAQAELKSFSFTQGSQAVPEPLTILGTGTAIAFGTGFKRKLAKAKKK